MSSLHVATGLKRNRTAGERRADVVEDVLARTPVMLARPDQNSRLWHQDLHCMIQVKPELAGQYLKRTLEMCETVPKQDLEQLLVSSSTYNSPAAVMFIVNLVRTWQEDREFGETLSTCIQEAATYFVEHDNHDEPARLQILEGLIDEHSVDQRNDLRGKAGFVEMVTRECLEWAARLDISQSPTLPPEERRNIRETCGRLLDMVSARGICLDHGDNFLIPPCLISPENPLSLACRTHEEDGSGEAIILALLDAGVQWEAIYPYAGPDSKAVIQTHPRWKQSLLNEIVQQQNSEQPGLRARPKHKM